MNELILNAIPHFIKYLYRARDPEGRHCLFESNLLYRYGTDVRVTPTTTITNGTILYNLN